MPNGENKRRSARYPLTTEVWWSVEDGDWEICETGDLSEVGCFIMSSKQPSVEHALDVSLRLGGGEWLRVKAKVVYWLEIGFGVEFVGLGENERKAIAACIKAASHASD